MSETQPEPDISTEHQNESDTRRPSDTLDRGPADVPAGNAQEDVEDRSNVGQVKPDDYPLDERAGGADGVTDTD